MEQNPRQTRHTFSGVKKLPKNEWNNYLAVVEISPAEEKEILLENRDPDLLGFLLHVSCLRGYFTLAKRLLKFGVDPNYRYKGDEKSVFESYDLDFTPLHRAVFNNQPEIMELLLRRNADVNARARHAMTPLAVAVACVRGEAFKLITILLDNDAKVTCPFEWGSPCGPIVPLNYACLHCNIGMMTMIVKFKTESVLRIWENRDVEEPHLKGRLKYIHKASLSHDENIIKQLSDDDMLEVAVFLFENGLDFDNHTGSLSFLEASLCSCHICFDYFYYFRLRLNAVLALRKWSVLRASFRTFCHV